MAKRKLTKTVAGAARPETVPYELRDTIIPGFLLKVTPTGRKIFMVAYVANDGQRRKPAIGRFGEITVEQARGIAQDWLADVRKGQDPSAPFASDDSQSRVGMRFLPDGQDRTHSGYS
jgi:Arm domain-containing DNA-binding protein